MENQPQRPPNYLAIAIISTILCCPIPGIVSIVYSTRVNSAYDSGDYAGAEKDSKNAKTWAIVSAVAAVAIWIVYIAIFGLAFLGAAANGGF